ncbi:hypothetical protein Bsel_0154 [[Bacillus] selenitireducens MLS10]|uniref:Uncharacterized protein n=1 Tax=Bacillus selenitireducens (strain ATCC 700615 / DSM 15326 / MLS10) TaxID=439292 RepID=D6XVT0_BACIE|nr:hypothetical protein Bsel_0154 [[Bacillus] selenitireducens MLS10]
MRALFFVGSKMRSFCYTGRPRGGIIAVDPCRAERRRHCKQEAGEAGGKRCLAKTGFENL